MGQDCGRKSGQKTAHVGGKGPKIKIEDNEHFRKRWASDLTVAEIGAIYGVTAGTVSMAAWRYRLPKRPRGGRPAANNAKVTDGARDAEDVRAEASRAIALVPRLTARGIDQDAAPQLALGLVRARAYADLDAVADRHGVPIQRLMPLWHEVRA